MYFRKKIRKRLIMVLVVVLGFIFWRGIHATTEQTHDCEFKLIYAVCTAKAKNAVMPNLWDIAKAGVKF